MNFVLHGKRNKYNINAYTWKCVCVAVGLCDEARHKAEGRGCRVEEGQAAQFDTEPTGPAKRSAVDLLFLFVYSLAYMVPMVVEPLREMDGLATYSFCLAHNKCFKKRWPRVNRNGWAVCWLGGGHDRRWSRS